MCGIYAYLGKNNAEKKVITGLKQLEYRGYDSWGVASITQNQCLQTHKNVGAISQTSYIPTTKSNIALGHTRWATHGNVSVKNAHPQLNQSHSLALVHNGVVENLAQLESIILDQNFTSETDTHRLVKYIDQLVTTGMEMIEIFNKVSQFIKGPNALVLVDLKTQSLYGLSMGLPLYIGIGKAQDYYITSDVAALPNSVSEYYLCETSYLAHITASNLTWLDLDSQAITHNPKKHNLTWISQSKSMGKFPHYTLKEIHDQTRIVHQYQCLKLNSLKSIAHQIKTADTTYLVGSGSSFHACAYGSILLNRMGIKSISCIASEFDQYLNTISPKDAVVMVSQSGETGDLLVHTDTLLKRNIKFSSLTNVAHASLTRLSHINHQLAAGIEKSVVSTKAFMAQILSFQVIEKFISGQPHNQDLTTVHLDLLKILDPKLYSIQLSAAVKNLLGYKNIFVLGKGITYPLALETSLKIKEACYLPAQALSAGELKHGSLALVDNHTLCLLHVIEDQDYDKLLTTAQEIKARGGKIMGLSRVSHQVFDYYLPAPGTNAHAQFLNQLLWSQLLSYHTAINLGINPDRPRNLAKSVTVS